MRFSILYSNANNKQFKLFNIADELNLKEIIRQIMPNESAYILDLLKKAPCCKCDIELRQENIKFFTENIDFYEAFKMILESFNKTVNEEEQIKDSKFWYGSNINRHSISLEFIKCVRAAIRIFSYIDKINDLFSNLSLNLPKNLAGFQQLISYMCDNDNYLELKNTLLMIVNSNPDSLEMNVRLKLNSLFFVESISVDNFEKNIIHSEEHFKKSFLNRFTKKVWDEEKNENVLNEDFNKYFEVSIKNFMSLINAMTKSVIDFIAGLGEELLFYEFSIRLINVAKKNNIIYSFPELSEQSDIKLESVYDINLVLNCNRHADLLIKSNDFIMNSDKGVAFIIGPNKSGKTVFLRSIALSCIFGNCGLPVLAQKSRLPMLESIFFHFAKEEQFNLNDYGHFEDEVIELKNTVDNLKTKSIVFINEIFQSTSEDEAVEALIPLITYFNNNKVNVIFVTHLKDLPSRFKNERLLYKFNTDFSCELE